MAFPLFLLVKPNAKIGKYRRAVRKQFFSCWKAKYKLETNTESNENTVQTFERKT